MSSLRSNIISQVLVVVLSTTLLFPLFVKLDHLFQDHEHEVCETPYTNHFHKYEIDCDYYDFTLSTIFFDIQPTYEFFKALEIHQVMDSQYQFISEYQQLHFSLRGPPLSV